MARPDSPHSWDPGLVVCRTMWLRTCRLDVHYNGLGHPSAPTCGSEKKNESLKSDASTRPVTNQPLSLRPASRAAAISFASIPFLLAPSPTLNTCGVGTEKRESRLKSRLD